MPQSNEYMLKQDDAELIYQKKLTAGTNITIDPVTNTISSTGGGGSSVSYSGSLPQGYGDTIGIITIDGTQYPIKVRNLIQGSNINIVQDMSTGNLTISSTAQGTHVEPNPSGTPTNTLDTIGINGTIYEIEGGGSGNVADVYVNGTSVLDENDIAQVFSHEEITKVNYDNLPSTKFSDNHMYLIKEAGTPPTGEYYNPIIYSTDEREVGVWTDGKPIYKRTWLLSNEVLVNSNGTTISEIDASMVEHLIDCNGGYQPLSNTKSIPILAWKYNNTWYYGSSINAYIDTVTLTYTKTTDVAGSGKYNTLGVPNVHYTTDEQVIGTWIDGTSVYKKVVVLASPTNISYNSWQDMGISITGGDKVLSCFGVATDGTNSPLHAYFETGGVVTCQTPRNNSVSYNIEYLIIEYTKTTD